MYCTARAERKAWVTKDNVPPPRRVFPPSRKGPGSKVEQMNVESASVTMTNNQPLRITVTHGEASNDDTSEGSSEVC